MEVHVHVPIRVRVVGEPDGEQLERLAAAVRRAVGGRLAEAERAVRVRHGEIARGTVRVGELYDPARDGGDGYAVPSYDHGQPIGVPVRRPGRGWTVLRSVQFHSKVGAFVDYAARADMARRTQANPGLYDELREEERWVTVWWVQVSRTWPFWALGDDLARRAAELAHLPPQRSLHWVLGTSDTSHQELAALNPASHEMARLPLLAARNARRLGDGDDGTLEIRHGAWVLFAFMVLPAVEVTDVFTIGAPRWMAFPLRDVAFLVTAEVFRRKTGLSWEVYLQEYGGEQTTIWLQPLTTRKRIGFTAAVILLDQYAEDTIGSGPPDSITPRGLYPLTAEVLGELPAAVRDAARGYTDPATLDADGSAGNPFLPGQRALYALSWLDVGVERLGTARYGVDSRARAAAIATLLGEDATDRQWHQRMRNLLAELEYSISDVRPPGGTLFEHTLRRLEDDGRLIALFDAVERVPSSPARLWMVIDSAPTRYATHPRILAMRQAVNAERTVDFPARYVPGGAGVGEIRLDKGEGLRVVAGQVFGDRSELYLSPKEEKQLKPERAKALREALQRAANDLAADILTGRDRGSYNGELFSRAVLARGCAAAHIQDADFVTVTIERSMRLLEVRYAEPRGLAEYYIRFQFVERVKGSSEWTAVGHPIEENHDDFGFRIIAWEEGRVGELLEKVEIGLTVVGVVVVAFEVGLVALLVQLGGGLGIVVGSIIVSELIHIFRVIFVDGDWSMRGFLEAALDGYLMAIGFKLGAGLGWKAAQYIGRDTAFDVVAGWFAQRLIAGMVGGASGSVLSQFAHDVIGIVLDNGSLSSFDKYLEAARGGAKWGLIGEFVIQPVLHQVLATGGSALESTVELARRVRAEGIDALRWSAAMTTALGNFRFSLVTIMQEVAAEGWVRAYTSLVLDVGERLGASLLSRRVLELAGGRFSREATAGLERFLEAAGATAPERAVALTNIFAHHPGETMNFLEALAGMRPDAARHLVAGTFGSPQELAGFLGRLGRYTAPEQRAIAHLLGELELEAKPPVPGLSPSQLLERQFASSLRVQAAGLETQAAELRARATGMLARAEAADTAGNPARAAALRAEADRLTDQVRALQEQASALREEAAGPPVTAPPPAAVHPRPPRRVVYLDHNVVDQIVRGNGRAAQQLVALLRTADVRISRWTWIELVERPGNPRTRAAQRLIVTDLGIHVDDPIPMEDRVDAVLAATPPRGVTGFSAADTQVAIAARAGGGELWSFDDAFAANPANARARFGIEVAPESRGMRAAGPQDYDEARRLLGLEPVDIATDGSVTRPRAQRGLPRPEDIDAALDRYEQAGADPATGLGAQTWIRLTQRTVQRDAGVVDRLVRPVFRSRSGNRVVFRVEGGTDPAARSRSLVTVDANGGVRVASGRGAVSLNFGVFERAIEFLLSNRQGARLVVFEIEEGWFQSLRSVATPEQGRPMVPGDPGIRDVAGLPRTVDTRYADDQLPIPPSLVPELQEFIVQGSGRVVEFTP